MYKSFYHGRDINYSWQIRVAMSHSSIRWQCYNDLVVSLFYLHLCVDGQMHALFLFIYIGEIVEAPYTTY